MVTVSVTTLDSFVAAGGSVPDIVKIDVETHEAAVVRGAAETIRAHRPTLVVEVLAGRRGRRLCS